MEERRCRVCGTTHNVYPPGKAGKICRSCKSASSRQWNLQNPDKVRKAKRDYYRRNPRQRLVEWQRYQERLAAVGGPPTPEDIQFIYLRDKVCLACGATTALVIDHILAVANGGDSSRENLQLLCNRCNSIKGTKTIDYRYP